MAYLYSRPCFAFYGELMFVREPMIIKFYRFIKNLTLNNIEEYEILYLSANFQRTKLDISAYKMQ